MHGESPAAIGFEWRMGQQRLAMDLYADECHCLWELMQNADDNK